MKRKQIGTVLLIVGAVLFVMSALGLFQIVFNLRENRYLVAVSGSMEPTFYSGTVLKVKLGVDSSEIHVGDIIAFHKPVYPYDIIVHRVIGEMNEGGSYVFTTQGDANPGPDWWQVQESDLVGKVVEINPPFWTYNFIFWIFILGLGTVFIVVGVVVRQKEPTKVGIVEEKPTPALAPELGKRVPEVKMVYCLFCGEELPSHAVYCRKCGKKVE